MKIPTIDEMLTVPDSAIPDLGDLPEEVPEAEVQEEESAPSPLTKVITDVLGIAPAMFLQLTVGLTTDEFDQKVDLYKHYAVKSGLAEDLAEYIEEYMPDWADDPRIAILMSLLMFGMMVGSDVRATMQAKKAQKEAEKRPPTTEMVSEPVPEVSE